jgi:hypothetical protein
MDENPYRAPQAPAAIRQRRNRRWWLWALIVWFSLPIIATALLWLATTYWGMRQLGD